MVAFQRRRHVADRCPPFRRAQEIFLSAMSAGQLRLLVEPASAEPPPPPAAGARVATVMPTKKPVPTSLSSRTQSVIQSSNTRKLGRRLTVSLVKGAAGLGFSVTTRDNPAGGHAPVYVKNILAQVSEEMEWAGPGGGGFWPGDCSWSMWWRVSAGQLQLRVSV